MNANNKQIYEHYKAQCNVDWGGDKYFYSANKYLIENLQSLRICPKCLQLHGKIRLWYGEWVEQHCKCDRKDESKWGDIRDFNVAYETCYCCGLEIIESGSKWSLFFCKDCKEAIAGLNDAVGRCLIPIGRHSMINRIGLASKDVGNNKAISDFIESWNSIKSRIVNNMVRIEPLIR